MLTPKLPETQKALVVQPQPVRIVLAEDLPHSLAVVLPPQGDMAEMEELKAVNFSIEELTSEQQLQSRKAFETAFAKLAEKRHAFSDSPVFLSKLASLARLAGYAHEEQGLAQEAYKLSQNSFYAQRLGDALIGAGETKEAERFLASLDLSADINANLRLAALCVERRDFDGAERFVSTAFEVDPLDFNTRLFEGGLNLFKGRYRAAIQSFRSAMNERPTSSSVHANMALAYLGLKEDTKALSCLRKAVALDPLNVSSVLLLSDLAFRLERDEDAVPALRLYLQFEQKSSAVWSRLARACYRIGKFDETILALKREGSLKDSGSVWNNLGVAYLGLKDGKRALESFTHAMRVDAASQTRSYFLAARNIAYLLTTKGLFTDVRTFVRPFLADDGRSEAVLRDEEVSDLVVFYVNALLRDGYFDEARQIARDALSEPAVSDGLSIWLVSALIAYQALKGGSDDVVTLAARHDAKAEQLRGLHAERRERYFNNVAFALAELGQIVEAEQHLSKIVDSIHKSAYPTATFGLIHFKKGNVSRAKELYEEAIRLAQDKTDKARIRQKLNLELGKYWANQDEHSRAKRVLERAIGERYGEEELAREAKGLIESLRRLPPMG